VDGTEIAKIVWALLILAAVIGVIASAYRRRGVRGTLRPGAGAYGAVYDLLNEDKRKAVEIIVEHKAESRDPERATDKNPCE
jgi:hypothetical protein